MHLLYNLKVAVGDYKKQHSMMLSFCYLFLLLNLIMYQVCMYVSLSLFCISYDLFAIK
ncbi:hypothetical protein HanRHA438_Chr16g0772241 [Helianthus annuus]|nr:hypothetical protein HanRHA438_Chr16g0772241 [Helianthus annuus]